MTRSHIDQESRIYPMTFEQEMMWLDDQLTSGPSRYLESWVYQLTGPVSREAISFAFRRIAARHEAMRSRFTLIDEQPVQVVLPPGGEERPAMRTCQATEIETILRELVSQPMDLDRGAARITVLDVQAQTVIVVAQLHHILIDDWALHLVEQEFAEHYNAYVARRQPQVSEVLLQPGSYALAQRAQPRDLAAHEYWREKLRDLPRVSWPQDRGGGSPRLTNQAERIVFRIDDSITDQIRITCKRLRVTPFTLFAAAGALLLRAERKNPDVLIGCSVSQRGFAERDLMIAPLTRLLPLRVKLRPDESLARLIADIKGSIHEAMRHSNILYNDLLRLARVPGQPAGTGLCPVVVVVDDAADSGIDIPGVTAQRIFVPSGIFKFDLYFYFLAEGGSYFAYLDYSTALFSESAGTRLTEDFVALLQLLMDDPDRLLAELVEGPRPLPGRAGR